MSLKILIADDSMTAQNMGKKILVDAGFDVVPVSNGAAAIKKIAETKPDIIILDIYMPGYTGLEVCEKVKNAPETANVPVLLTVGKLEPYRPEEGAKVRAEGVIIKPFEASDLLSALGRIAQKYNLNVPQIDPVEIAPTEPAPELAAAAVAAIAPPPPPPPAYENTMRLSTSELQSMLAKGEHAHGLETATVASPESHVAQEPAIPEFIREATAAAAAPAPMFIIEETQDSDASPAYSFSDLSIPSNEAPAYLMDEAASTPQDSQIFGGVAPFTASSIPDEDQTGDFRASSLEHVIEAPTGAPATLETMAAAEAPSVEAELESTAAAKVETHVENLAELESADQAPVEVEALTDPSLVTDPDELMQFTIKVGTDEQPQEEYDPLSREVEDTLYTSEEATASEQAPVEVASASEPEVTQSQHTYEDDPLVQMGVISIDHQDHAEAPSAYGEQAVEDELESSFAPASGLEGALHEFEATAQAETHEVAEVPSTSEPFSGTHEEIASAAAEPYVEPEVVAEPVSELAPEANHAASVIAQMAAVAPELAEPTHAGFEPQRPSQEHQIEESLTAEVERVAEESKEEVKSIAAAVGRDASMISRAVQRVFERYREKMVADITDELSKGE